MNLHLYDYCLVIDLEATCCDQQTITRSEMEIIEIGAVMVELQNLSVVSEFQTFVKPVRHPFLTQFCQQLTSITQDQVNHAQTYPEAVKNFKNWFLPYLPESRLIWGSWGDYDRKQFEQDSQFHQVSFPLGFQHFNLKKLFSHNQGLKGRYGMAQALQLAKIPLEGTHHRGIDDARNITKLMPYILGLKKL